MADPKYFNYTKNIKDTGFDISKDINNLTLFMPFEMLKLDKITDSQMALIVEGKFDTKKLLESMKEISNEVIKNRPKVKYTFSEEDGIPTVSFTGETGKKAKSYLIDNSFLIFGSESGATAAKAVKMGKSPSIKTNKEFATVLDKLNKEANFSIVLKINDEARQAISKVEKAKALETIQFVGVDLKKETDLLVKVNGYFSDSADMESVAKIMKMFMDSGKKTKFPFTAFVDFIENSKLAHEGKIATIDSKITQNSIAEIVNIITTGKPKPKQTEK